MQFLKGTKEHFFSETYLTFGKIHMKYIWQV